MYNIVDGTIDFHQRVRIFSQQKQASKAEIRRTLRLLWRPGEVHELRVVKHRLGTIAGFYDNPDKLAEDAYELTEGMASVLNRWGKNEPVGDVGSVYVTLNPVKGHKLALAGMDNRCRVVPNKKDRDESGWLTEDRDITDRHLILIDNDPCRGGQEIASTDVGWRMPCNGRRTSEGSCKTNWAGPRASGRRQATAGTTSSAATCRTTMSIVSCCNRCYTPSPPDSATIIGMRGCPCRSTSR
jgi:hypothetical protein